jgi:excisionase family DNA binding protein
MQTEMKPEIEKRALTVEETCRYLGGISRPTLYRLLGEGELESFHIGTRRYFTRESLDQWINQRVAVGR